MDALDHRISDNMFLDIKRRQGEANIIKTAIMRKLYNGETLSPALKAYLKEWRTRMEDGNSHDVESCMMPSRTSGLALGDTKELSTNIYSLDSLSTSGLLSFTDLENLSLTDICTELSLFIDPESVHEFERGIINSHQAEEWGLPADFNPEIKRNKETAMLVGELEENAFRRSGRFHKQDFNAFNKMLSLTRGKTTFDKPWAKLDRKSMYEFLHDINN